jgi:hypothetical protein
LAYLIRDRFLNKFNRENLTAINNFKNVTR